MAENMVILRTSPETIASVVRQAKYALRGELRDIKPGDIMLIAQKAATVPDGRPIRYAMRFVRCYRDIARESDQIWGRHWDYMVEGVDCRALQTPFDIRQVQVTKKNYAQGGTVVYVEPDDIKEIRKSGFLGMMDDTTTQNQAVPQSTMIGENLNQVEKNVALLERIDQLRRSGALNHVEFEALKRKVLDV